ncbi:MAG: hypothetical protein PHF44_02620 [Candidatus Pacebacteria bacterium]|nr:hypothetical protein [Candidatus Paceibacterota bacterium]
MSKKILLASLFLTALVGFLFVRPVLGSETTGSIVVGIESGANGIVRAVPTITPATGEYHSNQTVTISSSGATAVCYTTGTSPSTPACNTPTACTTGTKYSSTFTVASTQTVKAVSCYGDNSSSSASSNTYTMTCTISSVSNGSVSAYPDCTITCSSGYTKSGNSCVADTPSGGGGGGGGGGTDSAPPVISQIVLTVSDNYVTVSWKTDEGSLSWVVYGTSTAYGSEVKTGSFVTTHAVTLPNLTSETTFYYQIKSKDFIGNTGSYTAKTVTTLTTGSAPQQQAVTTTPSTPTTPSTTKPLSQMTIAELKAKIAEILALIYALQAKLAQLQGTAPSNIAGCTISTFARSLRQGDTNEDVKCLQIILNSDLATQIASSGTGSPGKETNYFGALTKAAVIRFQEKYASEILTPSGLTAGTGMVGNATREKLNRILGQ